MEKDNIVEQAAKKYINLSESKVIDEEEMYYNSRIKEYIAFKAGWKACIQHMRDQMQEIDTERNDQAAIAAYLVSMDRMMEGKLTIARREDYRWGFYDGWLSNPEKNKKL